MPAPATPTSSSRPEPARSLGSSDDAQLKVQLLTPDDLGETDWPWVSEEWVWHRSPDTEPKQVILASHQLSKRFCADLLRAGCYPASHNFETFEIHPVPVRWLGLFKLGRRTFERLWSLGGPAKLLALALRWAEGTVNGRFRVQREILLATERRYREEARRRERGQR